MKILKLTQKNFRNLSPGDFQPEDGVNIIYGDNAQGKTNLIEALWLFTGAKSFRGSRDRELVTFAQEKALLNLDFYAQNREQSAEITIDEQRKASRAGAELPPSALRENFSAVVFSPAHLSLVRDGPEVRRRFLDFAVAQSRPGFDNDISNYQRALRQRNAIVRDLRVSAELHDLLDIYEERLSIFGEKLIRLRKMYIEALLRYIPEIYKGISGGREELAVKYLAKSGETAEEISSALKNSRSEDMKLGYTTNGPHRDDIEFLINGVAARSFGSQGQQRSVVLSVKLAEAGVLERAVGERPVILLDDIMSELDPLRQDYLLNHIGDSQIFITCCDKAETMRLAAGAVFHVTDGKVEKEDS